MRHPVPVITPGGLVLLVIALAVPSQDLVMDPAAPAVSLAVAAAGVLFSGILFAIVFRAGEWPPATLALGCVAMAFANIGHVASPLGGFDLLETDGIRWLPNLGMILGGAFFGAASLPRWPAGRQEARNVRRFLFGATVVLAIMVMAVALGPIAPGDGVTRVMAALASAGYALATFQFLAAYRFARLPSQLTTAVGTAAFIPLTILLAAGGAAGMPASLFQLLMLVAAAFPVAGFIIEQRSRPGLRTMVLSLWLPRAVEQMHRGHPGTMQELLERIGNYDLELRGHVDRVSELAIRVAAEMNVDPATLRRVMLAAQVHDIGKLFVPKSILDKPGRLDAEEFAEVKRHSEEGASLVRRVPGFEGAVAGVLQHHERWDGSGYPEGLTRTDIALEARILAVADVYDALVSARSYKNAWARDEAVALIRSQAGREFDPEAVAALMAVVGRAESASPAA